MNILIGVATYPTDPALYPETEAALEALQGQTSVHNITLRLYGNDDPALDPKDNIVAKHNRMRADVLEGAFDALLTVEADMIVPPDAVEKLTKVEADVAYALYISRHHTMPLAFPKIDGFKGRSIAADPDLWRDKLAAGDVIPTEGAGFGCTLIHRRVLEQVSFRRVTGTRRSALFADDWTFALDVKEAGFKSAHHLGVQCGHLAHDGRVLWPDAAAENFARWNGERRAESGPQVYPDGEYRVLKRAIWHAGQNRYYRKGERIPLVSAAATFLAAQGLIGAVE
jgi:hypothetical protein